MYIICPAQSLIDYHHTACNQYQVINHNQESSSNNNHDNRQSVSVGRNQSVHKVAAVQNTGSTSGGGGPRKTSPGPPPGGGAPDQRGAPPHESLRVMSHPAVWPTVKNHINTSLVLVKNLTDLTQELSQMYEHHAEELQLLVANYRKKNAELRKDSRPGANCMLEVWESMLQGVEADSASHSEVAAVLSRQVSRQTLERSFFRKLQARKLLQHRESLDTIVTKAEDHLAKCRQDYKSAYTSACSSPNSSNAQAAYLDAHNTYVTQLHATNAIVDTYAKETLPDILQELEDVYGDLCKTMAESLAVGAEILSNRTGAQSRRWCTLWSECKAVEPSRDTMSLIRTTVLPSQPHPSHRLRLFTPPQPMDQLDPKNNTAIQQDVGGMPMLKNELVQDRLASLQPGQRYDALCEEANQLQLQIQQLQDSLTTMLRLQQRSLESQLFNKANEIQEDISKKRYELRTVQLNFSANRAQRELFSAKVDNVDSVPPTDRKMSSASSISMKSKWLKAFKSLKTPPPNNGTPKETEKDKKNQMYHAVSTIIAMRRENEGKAVTPSDSAHQFQEYTYKKITPCDVCSQVLRGHTRQGLKCRICKLNVHIDCQERVGKCQTKSRLLRRQKSSSEIETRVQPPQVQPPTPHSNSDIEQVSYEVPTPTVDNTYQILKTANDLSTNIPNTQTSSGVVKNQNLRRPQVSPHSTSSDYGSGSQPRRRHHVFGMKKFIFGHRTHERASSLPESQYLFGQNELFPNDISANRTAPHSPRRQKLNLRMKSLSLDSPESTEHTQRRRQGGNTPSGYPASGSGHASSHSSSSRLQSPSSPVHNRRLLLSARNMRMSSVELPDDERSSASTSPCPSPVGRNQKPHRLLPTNLYVVLYNFKARHADELDLKPGYKVTVIDTGDPDWWRGKCLGRVGFFPSKYVAKLQPGERPLQVTHNLQVASDCTLLRDQIVIQIGEEIDGMVMIRCGDNRQGVCPVKYLQEV